MNIGVVSMNAGKMTPLVDARSDIGKYSSGCRILENMIPRIYGPVERRPGTLYIAEVEDMSKKSRMFSFIYSATVAYKIEFADKIINVYYGSTEVDSNIATPYLEADLPQLQFEQSADVMWITHPSYAPRKFSRTSVTEFSLDTISFTDGPFKERNDIAEDDDVTITVTGYDIATATNNVAEAGSFTITSTTDISSLFPDNGRFYVTNSTDNDAVYTVYSSTYVSPTLTIVTNEAVGDGTDDGEITVNDGAVTLTASSATFTTGDSGHADSLWKITHKRLQTVAKGTAVATGVIDKAIEIKGAWTFTTSGNWDATIELQRNADGANWEVYRTYVSTMTGGAGSRNVQKSDVEESNGVLYRINVTAWTEGTIEADLIVDESTQDSIYKISSVTSTTVATATSIVAPPDNVAAKRWAEGSWSHVQGWPIAVTFFEERIVYGFNNLDQQTIWLSKTGKFENFDAGILDSSSFAITVPTANKGRWLGALDTLAVGTTGGEWRIRSTREDEALTPLNFTIKQQTQHGSADIQAIKVNSAVLFIDFVARKVREYTFNEQQQKIVSPDLTALAEDITSGGITSVAVQRNPDSIIWFTIANSPYLISMTYEREQDVVAFAEHPIGGDGIVESICVTPSTNEDVVTMTVRRTINGATVRYIEEMQPRDFGSTTDPTDAFFVDAGIIDTGGTTTISDLGHLEGEEVAVFVDGAVQAKKTVSSAEITIDEAGDRAVVGLPCPYQVSPMRMDVSIASGTTYGSIQKVAETVISFFATGNAQYKSIDQDGVESSTHDIDWRTTEPHDSPPNLFTGNKMVVYDSGFSADDKFVILGSDPLPCVVRAIILRTEKVGR